MWEPEMRAGEVGGRLGRTGLALFAATQRRADRRSAARPDRLLANSTAVAERIRRYWGRDSTVVYGPADVTYYHPDPDTPREDFFLFAGRLVPYKRPDLAAAAAARAGVNLVVAGEGRSQRAVEQEGGTAVRLLGRVTDEQLRDLYRRCRALIMPGVEDLGLVPIEAQACGAPVIAVNAGGCVDTVSHGRTGRLIPKGTDAEVVAQLALEMRRFQSDAYDPEVIRAHAEFFSRDNFRRRVGRIVEDELESTGSQPPALAR
jgi:glycosyltransferase involved in cell wall biosynthesis